MPKRPVVENLVPLSMRTKDEQREITRAGGRASGKARREKATVAAIYADLLASTYDITLHGKKSKKTGTALLKAVALDILQNAGAAARVAMLKEIREANDGSKVAITNQDGGPFNVFLLSREEAQARLDELRAKQDAQ